MKEQPLYDEHYSKMWRTRNDSQMNIVVYTYLKSKYGKELATFNIN